MHDNEEKIFDDFIKDKLDQFIPGDILMESSYQSFLAERQQKKRGGFFWIFLPLFFIGAVISSFYFFGDHSPVASPPAAFRAGNNESPKKNKEDITLQIPVADSFRNNSFSKPNKHKFTPIANETNKIAIRKMKTTVENKEAQTQRNETELIRSNHELVLIDKKIQINQLNAKVDSTKKEIKKPIEDTFYIVW